MKNTLLSVFTNEFVEQFYYSRSFTYDVFRKNGNVIFRRITVSSEYVEKEYKCQTTFGCYSIERMAAPTKWDYLKHMGGNDFNIAPFINLFQESLQLEYYITTFDPAKHSDWPGYHLCRSNTGSRITILSPERQVPIDVYGFLQKTAIEDQDKATKAFFYNEWKIDVDKMLQLTNAIVFVFLYDDASIADSKIFQDQDNPKKEGADVTLNVARFLHPFPKLELECVLLNNDEAVLLSEKRSIESRFDVSHRFLSTNEGEIHRSVLKLYENGRLIDDYSGSPIRKIQVSMHVKGQEA